MKNLFLLSFLLLGGMINAQTITYSISFDNAVHHEAEVKASFTNVTDPIFSVRMSRTSPGRYAIHEFAKNVYNVVATDSNGKQLQITRPNPYQWDISGHDGTVNVSYTLYADHGDGTYSQIDETHAHLNIPATFMFAPSQPDRRVEVTFNPREDLNWKVATQLKPESGNTYSAPNLQYFMDSPTEISNWDVRQFEVESSGKKYNVRFVLHHNGTSADLDTYFEKVKKVVLAEKDVYGELADYDFGTYTFLACYLPNVSGDGMEHRNSTILTDREGLAEGGMEGNIGTVSHEFFHSWNVERIRPKALEPFDFTEANMSGELWFAEGFTSYYTNLILCRAEIITPEQYIEGLDGTFNYVWNSPARQFFNPIEMSYQAPFVDAATAVDPVNRENTFISYYSYGSVLGLALDLSLRQNKLNLDDYMKLVWQTYGKNEKPYTVKDLHETLKKYAGSEFGDMFFNQYIYNSEMPDYKMLLASVGVNLIQNATTPYFGASVYANNDGSVTIRRNTYIGSPAYKAGLDRGHVITAINDITLSAVNSFDAAVAKYKVGDKLKVTYIAYGETRTTQVALISSPIYKTQMAEKEGVKVDKKTLERRNDWLN